MTTTMAHRLAPPAGQHETNNALHPHQRTIRHGMSDSGSRHIGRRGDAPRGQGEGSYASGWGIAPYESYRPNP